MGFCAQQQVEEALGNDNKWFCSEKNSRCVEDKEELIRYYIKNGGAEDFRRRYNEAMSEANRWYCSQYYGYPVNDERTLWNYYIKHAKRTPPDGQKSK